MGTVDSRHRTINGDGIELAVWEHGDPAAPTVVLVHGYPDTHVVWDRVAADLAADHHVVTYDVRGAGASGTPQDREGYDLDHLIADLAAVIDAVSPDEPIHLVGHDWGSIQSWPAITDDRLAGRVASFTSISGPSLDHVSRWVRARRRVRWQSLRELLGQGTRSWYVGVFQIPGLAELAWRSKQPAAFRRYLTRAEGVPPDALPGPTLATDGANGVGLYRQNIPAPRAPQAPPPIEIPVQVIVATRDRFVSVALLDGLGEGITRFRRREIDGGHWLVIPRAPEFAGMVRDQVREAGSA